MLKTKPKPIKIGGRALGLVQKMSANTYSTMKHTAEVLIELGQMRLTDLKNLEISLKEEINKFKRRGDNNE